MLPTDKILSAVLHGANGLIDGMPSSCIHMASGTHGVPAINAAAEEHFAAGQTFVACPVLGRPDLADDPRARGAAARIENRDFLDPLIEGWLAGLTRAEAVDRLNAAGVPAGPVHRAEDVFACPQVAARGTLLDIDDPEVGAYSFARTPPRLSAAPEPPTHAAPALGQHSRAVLEELGYDAAEIAALADAGVIGLADGA